MPSHYDYRQAIEEARKKRVLASQGGQVALHTGVYTPPKSITHTKGGRAMLETQPPPLANLPSPRLAPPRAPSPANLQDRGSFPSASELAASGWWEPRQLPTKQPAVFRAEGGSPYIQATVPPAPPAPPDASIEQLLDAKRGYYRYGSTPLTPPPDTYVPGTTEAMDTIRRGANTPTVTPAPRGQGVYSDATPRDLTSRPDRPDVTPLGDILSGVGGFFGNLKDAVLGKPLLNPQETDAILEKKIPGVFPATPADGTGTGTGTETETETETGAAPVPRIPGVTNYAGRGEVAERVFSEARREAERRGYDPAYMPDKYEAFVRNYARGLASPERSAIAAMRNQAGALDRNVEAWKAFEQTSEYTGRIPDPAAPGSGLTMPMPDEGRGTTEQRQQRYNAEQGKQQAEKMQDSLDLRDVQLRNNLIGTREQQMIAQRIGMMSSGEERLPENRDAAMRQKGVDLRADMDARNIAISNKALYGTFNPQTGRMEGGMTHIDPRTNQRISNTKSRGIPIGRPTRKQLAYQQEQTAMAQGAANLRYTNANINAKNKPSTTHTFNSTQGKNFKAQWPKVAAFAEEMERDGRVDLIGMFSKWLDGGADDGTDYKGLRGWFAEKKLDFPETYPHGA